MSRPYNTYSNGVEYNSPSNGDSNYNNGIVPQIQPMNAKSASHMHNSSSEIIAQHNKMMAKGGIQSGVVMNQPHPHLNPQQSPQQSSFLNSSNVWLMPPLQTMNQRPPQLQQPAEMVGSPPGSGYVYPGNGGSYMPFAPQLPYPPINNPSLRLHDHLGTPPMATQVQPIPNQQLQHAGLQAPVPVPVPMNYNMQMAPAQYPMNQIPQQQYMGNPLYARSELSSPLNESQISKEARMAQMNFGNTFKPITPKKNSRPRINKLTNQVDKKVMKKILKVDDNDYKEAEPSMDPYFLHFLNSLKLSKEVSGPTSPCFYSVDSQLEKKLFDLFIHEMSACMDMFMMGDFFAEIVPEMALLDESGLILSSMYSLSALMLQRIDPESIDLSIPINYYHQTIKSIRHHLSLPNSGDDNDGTIARCLLSTILLGVYEMFFLATDNTYVKGAVSLLTSIISKTEGSSPLKTSPFLQMCFWAMFVCDLILSLKFNLPTMFSIKNFWLQVDPEFIEPYISSIPPKVAIPNDPNRGLFISKKEATWWLHRALIQFSVINEFNCEVVVLTVEESRENKVFHEWLKLNKLADEFEINFPDA